MRPSDSDGSGVSAILGRDEGIGARFWERGTTSY